MSESRTAQLLIAADMCPIGRNEEAFLAGDRARLVGEFAPEFDAADFVIANLECPLVGETSPVLKTGPIIGAKPGTTAGIKAIGIDLLTLANNHILDHGEAGLASTLQACRSAGIDTVGAAHSREEAARPFRTQINGRRISVVAAAEEEFIATDQGAGAFPMDPGALVLKVIAEAADADDVVVLLHAGFEGYLYPSPRLRSLCHQLVQAGARIVVCQHSHVAGCWEEVGNALIVYGQGNFIFHFRNPDISWKRGFLAKVQLSDAGPPRMTAVPFHQPPSGNAIERMAPADETAFMRGLEERSRQIGTPGFVEASWKSFSEELRPSYMARFLAENRIVRSLLRRSRVSEWFWSAGERRILLNLIRCATHREVLVSALKDGP
jgi:hypothetical protein